MAVTEREGGRGRVLVSLLNPDSPSYSSGGGDNGDGDGDGHRLLPV
jgi:hypothetical protein